MELNRKFYSTRSSSLTKYYNMLSASNLKLIRKPLIYHPINPIHPFNIDMLNLKEISKRKNALLINNKSLKDKILKFSMDEKKNLDENNDPNKYYFNKFRNEEKNYQLTIRALLKNEIDNFPLYQSERNGKENKKKKKIKINFSRNDNHSNLNNTNLRLLTSYSQIKTSNQIKTELNKDLSQYIKSCSKSKNHKLDKEYIKNMGIKMKILQKIKKNKILKLFNKGENRSSIIKKNLSFAATNIKSLKLGRISIYCVFEEIGPYGKQIVTAMINYLIEYFKLSKEMNVCRDKNNFYSILHWSFLNAQKYLIEKKEELNIDLMNSGCMACFLLQPKNKSNIIYWANSGICKCLLYTNRGPDLFSFLLTINRPCEKDRIGVFLRNQKISKALEKIKEEQKDYNNINNINNLVIEEKEKNNKKDNPKEEPKKNKENIKIEINEEQLQKDKENSFKYFNDIGFTRCFGKLNCLDIGLIPDPEINECDIKVNKVRYVVLGNCTFWKLLKENEIRFITSKYVSNRDNIGANKELEDLIRQKVGTNSKMLGKCGFEVIYFDNYIY